MYIYSVLVFIRSKGRGEIKVKLYRELRGNEDYSGRVGIPLLEGVGGGGGGRRQATQK